jgi:hypothetical protein
MIEHLTGIASKVLNQRHVVGFWSMDVEVKEVLAMPGQHDLFWVVAISKLHHPAIEEERLEIYLIDKNGTIFSRGPRFEGYRDSIKTNAPAFLPLTSIVADNYRMSGNGTAYSRGDRYPYEVMYSVGEGMFEFVSSAKPSKHFSLHPTVISHECALHEFESSSRQGLKEVVSVRLLVEQKVAVKTTESGHEKEEVFRLVASRV